jgi:hypothetical protein
MRTREEVRAALDGNFKQLMDCLGQLTEDELTSTSVAGTWTVKDVMAHLWSCGDEAVQTIKAWQKPRRWQEGVAYDDAWNEAQVAGKSVLPLITVVDGITAAHRRLMHHLDLADEETLAQVGRAPRGEEMFLLDFLSEIAVHYAEHSRDLAVYQGYCLSSDGQTGGDA